VLHLVLLPTVVFASFSLAAVVLWLYQSRLPVAVTANSERPQTERELCIAAHSARCECTHARAAHPCVGPCTCIQFAYAGGLVPMDYQFEWSARPSLVAPQTEAREEPRRAFA
jgi:hypothetical protein